MVNKRISSTFVVTCILSLFVAPGCTGEYDKEVATISDQFSQHIRTTEARSPEDEKRGFQLPDGFEAQLFASEPDIGKPLNMTFDDRGRMWLTQSFEYPFPDTTGAPRDRISILEDTDGDGRADKIDVFADSLNIPIGIVKVPDGVIAYSIPEIAHFKDINDDDRVDERRTLFKGFQYKDTHGMINNLIRSWDGWIHADHGFANRSQMTNGGPDTLTMQSGNTFRFKPDASAAEFTTTGRVNPYGYAYDELGYTYSTDCHTSPIYQLIRGADYPHFGKKPTGIGFGPALMKHTYGATALAGLEYYLGQGFPSAYQHSFYYGDVVKCRVYRATMDMHGTTPVVRQEEDFIISEDPWFRPVDVKMGPDGALYIADFYNSIIGHYEVPLDHPARDRYRGRIWRIVHNGDETKSQRASVKLHGLSLEELIDRLNHPQLPFRMSVSDQIVDSYGPTAIPALMEVARSEKNIKAKIQGLWMLYRLSSISNEMMEAALQSPNDTVQVHALRILFELGNPDETWVNQAHGLLRDNSPHVRRQAVMVLSKHPDIKHLTSLLELRQDCDEGDSHLLYSIRQSLRDQLRNRGVREDVISTDWDEGDLRFLLDVMVGVDHVDASTFITQHLSLLDSSDEKTLQSLTHAARFAVAQAGQSELVEKARSLMPNSLLAQRALDGISQGFEAGGQLLPIEARKWSSSLVKDIFSRNNTMHDWKFLPYLQHPYVENRWHWIDTVHEGRECNILISDLMGWQGNATSILRSPGFHVRKDLEILLMGHQDAVDQGEVQPLPDNRLEVRTIDGDDLVSRFDITTTDYLQVIEIKAKRVKDREIYLSLVDGSPTRGEFIGMATLGPSSLVWPAQDPAQYLKDQIWAMKAVRNLNLVQFADDVRSVLDEKTNDIVLTGEAAKTLLAIEKMEAIDIVDGMLEDTLMPNQLHQMLILALLQDGTKSARTLLGRHLNIATYDSQRKVMQNMLGDKDGIDFILHMATQRALLPRLLLENRFKEPLLDMMTEPQHKIFASITEGVKMPNEDMDAMIDKRLRGYGLSNPDLQRGQMLEVTHCSPCHSIDGKGGNIGPQIDGIGNWGARALTEKILDPNRNISKAFMNYTIQMKDGSMHSGLFRREEGAVQVFADAAGAEFTLKSTEIQEKTPSPYTLMPDQFGTLIPEADYYDLLAFLLHEK